MVNQQDELDLQNLKDGRRRSRVREIDFMRAEDAAHGQALSPFELEVKGKLASGVSPLDELMLSERDVGESHAKRIPKYKRACLLRRAKLTLRQRQVYRLICVKGYSATKTARILGISRPRVVVLKKRLLGFIQAAMTETKLREKAASRAQFACKTGRKRLIWELYFKHCQTISEIARKLKLSRQAVHRAVKRMNSHV